MLLKNVPAGSTVLVEQENKEYIVGGYWWDGKQRQLISDGDSYTFLPDTTEVVVLEYYGL